jgi:hypothetical protein
MIYYNPLDKFYKSQIGAISSNQKITFRVKSDFDSVIFVCQKDGDDFYKSYSMIKVGEYFEIELVFGVGLYFYSLFCCFVKNIFLQNYTFLVYIYY